MHPAVYPLNKTLRRKVATVGFSFVGAVLVSALVVGCGASGTWDIEYACTGEEQTNSQFTGDDASVAIQKKYPITIDFHLRSGKVFVKSYMTPIEASAQDILGFSATSDTSWLTGKFDKRDGQLMVVESRTLPIAGRAQRVITTGQYTCKTGSGSPGNASLKAV